MAEERPEPLSACRFSRSGIPPPFGNGLQRSAERRALFVRPVVQPTARCCPGKWVNNGKPRASDPVQRVAVLTAGRNEGCKVSSPRERFREPEEGQREPSNWSRPLPSETVIETSRDLGKSCASSPERLHGVAAASVPGRHWHSLRSLHVGRPAVGWTNSSVLSRIPGHAGDLDQVVALALQREIIQLVAPGLVEAYPGSTALMAARSSPQRLASHLPRSQYERDRLRARYAELASTSLSREPVRGRV
jgi:hypothetical protein